MTTCPTGADLAADVEKLTEQRLVRDEADADVLLQGGIAREGEGYRARVVMRSRAGQMLGERAFEGGELDCASLRGPLALVLTMLIESAEADPSRSRAKLGVGLHGAVLTGALPRAVGGAGASLTLRFPSVRLSAIGTGYLPVDVEGRAIRARLTVWTAGLELCARIVGDARSVHALLCASAHGGAKKARTEGLRAPSEVARLLLLGQVELMGVLPMGRRAALLAAVGLTTYWTRPHFYFDQSDGAMRTVHRSPLLGVGARLGVSFDLH